MRELSDQHSAISSQHSAVSIQPKHLAFGVTVPSSGWGFSASESSPTACAVGFILAPLRGLKAEC
jgi:hypothetical protein